MQPKKGKDTMWIVYDRDADPWDGPEWYTKSKGGDL